MPGLGRLDDEQDKVGAYEYELQCVSVQRKGFGRRHAPTKLQVIAGEADSSGRGHRTGVGGMAGYKRMLSLFTLYTVLSELLFYFNNMNAFLYYLLISFLLKILIWLHWVLVAAHGISSHSMWDL